MDNNKSCKSKLHRPKLPPWIRVKVSCGEGRKEVAGILKDLELHTVCSSAQCPNLNECWHRGTATFMILGDQCTRNCKFCAVNHQATPTPPDPEEPEHVAEAAARMKLKYVVITSVTRDDLPDGGAGQFAAVIKAVHARLPEAGIEVLTPDFNADPEALRTVLEAGPTVFNHNVETVRRLAGDIRSKATYDRSLRFLRMAYDMTGGKIPVKSGLMVGLGETDEEVKETLLDLRKSGVTILTIGQYLPPSKKHWPLARYVEPEKFEEWAEFARNAGFEFVASAPMVRSSYNAGELIHT
ncbi:lipoyl synthase [Lentisphaerota bacterium ZTH]|nr:lipoyl synthase [Lentisphaerota bacterium]WET06619.1 lipoyl synthase [Lentisphaerota bacterium ZTH]